MSVEDEGRGVGGVTIEFNSIIVQPPFKYYKYPNILTGVLLAAAGTSYSSSSPLSTGSFSSHGG